MNKTNQLPTPPPQPKVRPAKPQLHITKTVDEQHNEIMRRFTEFETVDEPKIKSQIAQLQTATDISDYDREEQIRKLAEKLRDHAQRKKRYLSENAKFIFSHFEQKKNTATNKKILTEFFRIKSPQANSSDNDDKPDLATTHRQHVNRFWKNTCNEIVNMDDLFHHDNQCTNCRVGTYVQNDEDGINCHNCGHFMVQYVNAANYGADWQGEITYLTYDRLVHFKEILDQFQAKHTNKISQKMIDDIARRIEKERITPKTELDYNRMREILKTLGYNKYFEHIQLINSIFGIEPPKMDKELYDTLCVLFVETRHPWALFCPPTRSNFFYYNYVLYQLCVLLDQRQFLPFIPLIKDIHKIAAANETWKKLCEYRDWEYIPCDPK